MFDEILQLTFGSFLAADQGSITSKLALSCVMFSFEYQFCRVNPSVINNITTIIHSQILSGETRDGIIIFIQFESLILFQ